MRPDKTDWFLFGVQIFGALLIGAVLVFILVINGPLLVILGQAALFLLVVWRVWYSWNRLLNRGGHHGRVH